MRTSVCIGALSLLCWAAGIVLYAHMEQWGIWTMFVVGLLFWLGAALAVMCLACSLVELAGRLAGWEL